MGKLAVVRMEATIKEFCKDVTEGGWTRRLPESVSRPHPYSEVWGFFE